MIGKTVSLVSSFGRAPDLRTSRLVGLNSAPGIPFTS